MTIMSLVCIFIRDIKKIIAYSSIVHINFSLIGFFSIKERMILIIVRIIRHGFISPLIFKFVDLSSLKKGSRNLELYKGRMRYK